MACAKCKPSKTITNGIVSGKNKWYRKIRMKTEKENFDAKDFLT